MPDIRLIYRAWASAISINIIICTGVIVDIARSCQEYLNVGATMRSPTNFVWLDRPLHN